MKPCPLINGLCTWLHDYQGARFYRIPGQSLESYLVRKPRGHYERLENTIETIAAEIEVSPRLLLAALALMQLPTRSITLLPETP